MRLGLPVVVLVPGRLLPEALPAHPVRVPLRLCAAILRETMPADPVHALLRIAEQLLPETVSAT